MDPLLQHALDYLEKKHPAHTAKLRYRIEHGTDGYVFKAVDFFTRYQTYITRQGKTIDYGLDCYPELISHMEQERMAFLRSGKYANSSFADVEKQIYLNLTVFEYHMHGLVFAQFFWPDQFTRFEFFSNQIGAALAKGGEVP